MAYFHLFEDVLALSGPFDPATDLGAPRPTGCTDDPYPPEEPCLPSCSGLPHDVPSR